MPFARNSCDGGLLRNIPGPIWSNRLPFPLVRKGIEDFGSPGEYSRLIVTLRCDFLTRTYLLKKASNVNQRASYEDRLMILYFMVLFVSLITRHWLRMRENSAALKLTTIRNTLRMFWESASIRYASET